MLDKIKQWFGPRILKTGLGVTVALIICEAFAIQPASFAAITVVINMQPSVSKALNNAWEQISINIAAILLAIALGMTVGSNPYIIGLGVIFMIALANRIGWRGVGIGVVSIIFILDAPSEQFLEHALARSISILLGLAVALVINQILAPPRYKKMFEASVSELLYDSSKFFLESIDHYCSSHLYNEYLKVKTTKLEERLILTRNLYEKAREEYNASEKMQLMELLLEVCRGFIERGENIEEMTRQRVKRRHWPDAPSVPGEISEEFQELQKDILLGRNILANMRDHVVLSFSYPHSDPLDTLDQEYWEHFDQRLDNWQRNFFGSYYIRALMEVSVVATEMRWASKRLRTIYGMTTKKETKTRS